MNMVYCTICRQEVEYGIEKDICHRFKGKEIHVEVSTGICKKCNTKLFVEELEDANIRKKVKAYQLEKGMIQPNKIISMRYKYKITQKELSEILDWPIDLLIVYESGNLQTEEENEKLKDVLYGSLLEKLVEEAYEKRRINRLTLKR